MKKVSFKAFVIGWMVVLNFLLVLGYVSLQNSYQSQQKKLQFQKDKLENVVGAINTLTQNDRQLNKRTVSNAKSIKSVYNIGNTKISVLSGWIKDIWKVDEKHEQEIKRLKSRLRSQAKLIKALFNDRRENLYRRGLDLDKKSLKRLMKRSFTAHLGSLVKELSPNLYRMVSKNYRNWASQLDERAVHHFPFKSVFKMLGCGSFDCYYRTFWGMENGTGKAFLKRLKSLINTPEKLDEIFQLLLPVAKQAIGRMKPELRAYLLRFLKKSVLPAAKSWSKQEMADFQHFATLERESLRLNHLYFKRPRPIGKRKKMMMQRLKKVEKNLNKLRTKLFGKKNGIPRRVKQYFMRRQQENPALPEAYRRLIIKHIFPLLKTATSRPSSR